eukprot:comp23520_c0_seq1/m.39510 comp23520_c0_seq1/g.39510  ORF comp23520_c0_seq1/g.39510 comp23520_c0_seq1/m.39510 type:complete len:491 (-) comp23520_c0_seq1:873-2345(-)
MSMQNPDAYQNKMTLFSLDTSLVRTRSRGNKSRLQRAELEAAEKARAQFYVNDSTESVPYSNPCTPTSSKRAIETVSETRGKLVNTVSAERNELERGPSFWQRRRSEVRSMGVAPAAAAEAVAGAEERYEDKTLGEGVVKNVGGFDGKRVEGCETDKTINVERKATLTRGQGKFWATNMWNDMVSELQRGITHSNHCVERRWGRKVKMECFSGKEVCDWLVAYLEGLRSERDRLENPIRRDQAVMLAKRLLQDHVFISVKQALKGKDEECEFVDSSKSLYVIGRNVSAPSAMSDHVGRSNKTGLIRPMEMDENTPHTPQPLTPQTPTPMTANHFSFWSTPRSSPRSAVRQSLMTKNEKLDEESGENPPGHDFGGSISESSSSTSVSSVSTVGKTSLDGSSGGEQSKSSVSISEISNGRTDEPERGRYEISGKSVSTPRLNEKSHENSGGNQPNFAHAVTPRTSAAKDRLRRPMSAYAGEKFQSLQNLFQG